MLELGGSVVSLATKWALVDSENRIVNTILWDGVSTWNQPSGLRAIPEAEAVGLPVLNPVPPRQIMVYPFDFIDRFTLQELATIQQSADPIVIKFRTKLQTMVSPINLDDQQTIEGLGYLEYLGLLAPGRANQLRGL